MTRYSRRTFLMGVTAGLAGYSAISLHGRYEAPLTGQLHGVASHINPSSPPQNGPGINSYGDYSNQRGGRVIAVEGSDLIIELSPASTQARLHLTPATLYDDGMWTQDIPIEPGDDVIAMGVPSTGAFEVHNIWTNATKVEGPVLAVVGGPVAPFQARVQDARDMLAGDAAGYATGHLVRLNPHTLYMMPPYNNFSAPVPMAPMGTREIPVAPGDHWLVAGRRLHDGTVLAVSTLPESV